MNYRNAEAGLTNSLQILLQSEWDISSSIIPRDDENQYCQGLLLVLPKHSQPSAKCCGEHIQKE